MEGRTSTDKANGRTTSPTPEELLDFILCCRYGELEELKTLIERFGKRYLLKSRDDNGNTSLHMAAANGHEGIVTYLVEQLPATELIVTNLAGNTPIHWAAMNGHIAILRIICPFVPLTELDRCNAAGRTALKEADERGTPESLTAAGYLLSIMNIDDGKMNLGEMNGDETNLDEGSQVFEGVDKLALEPDPSSGASNQPANEVGTAAG